MTTPKSTKVEARGSRKRIEEVVTYAVGHRIRVHILILLNEDIYSASEIAELIDEPLNTVSRHIGQLLDAGSIELVEAAPARNMIRHRYRAVEQPMYSDEEVAAMTEEQRQITAGLAIQGMIAETLAGLWSGNMNKDPRLWLSWNWFNVDEQGRGEIADELEQAWNRVQEIEVESINRSAGSQCETTSIFVSQAGFKRARKPPGKPKLFPEP